MINIFPDGKTKKSSKKSKSSKASRPSKLDLEKKGKDNLDKLNPIIFALLSIESKNNPNNDFISKSIFAVTEEPHRLSDKWIASLNRWADEYSKRAMLDPPEVEAGSREDFSGMVVKSVLDPKPMSEYPSPALICLDDKGWSWYMRTTKAYDFVVGDILEFKATISSHGDGITFLRRPSKIKKSVKISVPKFTGEKS